MEFPTGTIFCVQNVSRIKSHFIQFFSSGLPDPEVSWFKSGEPIKPRPEDTRVCVEIDTSDHVYTLEVQDAKPSDSGEYAITAVNSAGKVYHAMSVNVQPKTVDEDQIQPEM